MSREPDPNVRYMIPNSVTVSRKTGKVTKVEYAEATERDMIRIGLEVKRIAKVARRTILKPERYEWQDAWEDLDDIEMEKRLRQQGLLT